eukprot:1222871-Prymnesium_polylepis.1
MLIGQHGAGACQLCRTAALMHLPSRSSLRDRACTLLRPCHPDTCRVRRTLNLLHTARGSIEAGAGGCALFRTSQIGRIGVAALPARQRCSSSLLTVGATLTHLAARGTLRVLILAGTTEAALGHAVHGRHSSCAAQLAG